MNYVLQVGDVVRPTKNSSSAGFNMKHQALGIVLHELHISITKQKKIPIYIVLPVYLNPFTLESLSINTNRHAYPIARKSAYDLLFQLYNPSYRNYPVDIDGVILDQFQINTLTFEASHLLPIRNVEHALAEMLVQENKTPVFPLDYARAHFNRENILLLSARSYQHNTLKSIQAFIDKMSIRDLKHMFRPRLSL